MRRVVGLVLVGLGTCLIVFAVLMPTYVSSRVLKFPLNEYETATLTAGNVTYFSPTKLTELTGVNMEATYTLKGDAAAGSSSTAVWNEFTYVYDQTNKLSFSTMTRTFAFNRRNAQLVDCCGANVNGDSSIRQTGYVGYVLPIGTQKQTYDVFDPNVNKPEPFTYAGTGTVDGIQAYRFVENVGPTQNGSQTLPGSLVNMNQASVTLPQYYQNQVTYWIDPTTGVLLNVTENEKLTLESSGTQALLLLDANFAATQASINRAVAQDNSGRSKVSLVNTILPLVTGIVGVVLLIAGILLARRPREDVAAATAAPEQAAESEEADSSAQQAAPASLVPGLDDEPQEAPLEPAAVRNDPPTPEPAEAAAPSAEASTESAEASAAEASTPEAAAQSAEAPAPEAPAAEAEAPVAEAEARSEVAEVPAEAVETPVEATDVPAADADAAEVPAAEAAPAEAAEAPAAEADVPETPETKAPPAETPAAEAATNETPAAVEVPEAVPADAPEATVESPAAAPESEAPAAESQAPAESPENAETPAEAPTAEIPAATAESPAADTPADANGQAQDANGEAQDPAPALPRRARRGARHRR
jgi:hypothetical protein